MKFDCVVGNPPYNSGMDLDFVKMAFELSSQYTVMITPAKWQTTSDDYQGCESKTIDYFQFRKQLVNHMSHVVFYPCCKDVFDILQVDGITYFLLDKEIHNKCIVTNKSEYIDAFNSEQYRSIINMESLINIGNEIVEYLGNYDKFEFMTTGYGRWQVWTNTQAPGGNLSTLKSKRKTYFIGESSIVDTLNSRVEHSNASICSFDSDSEDECKSFLSWLNCKFTRFFTAINQSKLTGILTDDCFRFVPVPPKFECDNPWNHIYTDAELYKAFNLPQKYIDVIESLVKDRK